MVSVVTFFVQVLRTNCWDIVEVFVTNRKQQIIGVRRNRVWNQYGVVCQKNLGILAKGKGNSYW